MTFLSEHEHSQVSIESELPHWTSLCPASYWNNFMTIVPEWLNKEIEGKDHVRILDVGSGPYSRFGGIQANNMEIIAIDSLAHEYNKLEFVPNLIKPICICGEDIGKIFPDEFFDVVHCCNSLDHCKCPWYVVQQINKTLKTGGLFYCSTNINEATRMKYHGLHQHNINMMDDGIFQEENSGTDLLMNTNLQMLSCKTKEVPEKPTNYFVAVGLFRKGKS